VAQGDEDDDAVEVAPQHLPELSPFPGGPKDLSVMPSHTSHVTLLLWPNANNVSVIYY